MRIARAHSLDLVEKGKVGIDIDIPAPDMNTNAQTMVWIMDTYLEMFARQSSEQASQNRVVTGKTLECGGSEGRNKATGQGCIFTLEEWAEQNSFDLSKSTFVVQGFGNVGSEAAKELFNLGTKIIAISDVSGGLFNDKGIDVDGLVEYASQNGHIKDYGKADNISKEDLFDIPCECFIPAAAGSRRCGNTSPRFPLRLHGGRGLSRPGGLCQSP